MRSSRWASATLATIAGALLLSACGGGGGSGSAGPGPTCSGSGHRVEVVVELGDHQVVDRCVSFQASQISGERAMHLSQIEFAIQHFSYGDAVCQLDHEPKAYTTCFPSGKPYWAVFLWSGGRWRSATVGISEVKLKSRQALGWRYDSSSGTAAPPPAPPKSFSR